MTIRMTANGRGRNSGNTGAICLPVVCSLTGERYPAEQIGSLPRPEGCFFVVDAAQAVGQVPVSVTALNCDILAATTRKWLRGPRDTALLHVSDRAIAAMRPNPAPRLFGIVSRGEEFEDKPGVARFDPSGMFAPQRLGLGVALDAFLADPDAAMAGPSKLAAQLRSGLLEQGHRLACPEAARPTAITTLRGVPDRIARLAEDLKSAGFAFARPSPDCEPLRRLSPGAEAFLRLSPHTYNTPDQIGQVLEITARHRP